MAAMNDVEFEVEASGNLVQADGVVRGRPFHFHAKHSDWSFEMANDTGEFPSDVGGNAVFLVAARHHDAGGMSPDEARRIIDDCIGLFLRTTAERLKTLGT